MSTANLTSSGPATSWVVCPRPNPQARLRLLCFHHAGGGASFYRSWAASLPDAVEFCAIQLPGRETRIREAAATRMTSLIDELAPALEPWLTMPYASFGHSMGAHVSYELARRRRHLGQSLPVHLFVSARRAPHLPERKFMYRLPREQFIAELRHMGGTPEEVLQHAELMELILPALRADYEVLETCAYTKEPPLDCPISAFYATADSWTAAEDVQLWSEHTTRQFRLREFAGGHFYLKDAQSRLLQAMVSDLEQTLRGPL